MIDAYL